MHEAKKKSLISLKKAKTSLEKIIAMIESEEKCSDIIVQNMAAIGLIKSANNKLIEAFMETCDKNQNDKKQELLNIFKLSHK